MSKLPLVPETVVMPTAWDDTKPTQFKLSLAPLDDLGFPYDRRSMTVTTPQESKDYAKFAKDVARQVENTVRMMLDLDLEEKND